LQDINQTGASMQNIARNLGSHGSLPVATWLAQLFSPAARQAHVQRPGPSARWAAVPPAARGRMGERALRLLRSDD
jgi:hypothetical protein